MSWIDTDGPNQDVAISSRIRLARNIEGYSFSGMLSDEDAKKVRDKVRISVFGSSNILKESMDFLNLDELPILQKYMLMEKHLISAELAGREIGSGLILKKDNLLSIMINEEDHLRIQAIFAGLQLDEMWDYIDKVDDLIENEIDYSYDDKLGYLTTCPTNLGTGMRVSAMLHLPALMKAGQLQSIMTKASRLGMTVRGFYGEGTQALGNIFQLSNQTTLGKSEMDIIENFKSTALGFIDNERLMRETVMESGANEIEDKVHRALGILMNARQIGLKEFMDLLSGVRLGICLQIIEDIDLKSIKDIMIRGQAAHLTMKSDRQLNKKELAIERAFMVREFFKDKLN